MTSSCQRLVLVTCLAWASTTCQAELIGGIEFPQGALSFADEVVSFSPGLVGGGSQPSLWAPA